MTVKEYCIEIHRLLMEVGETNWAKCFENFISALEQSDNKATYKKILGLYGGMGSFNDLVLYKNNVVCQKENDELSALKKWII